MENKKLIIFLSDYLKERAGGPSTYLFNLYDGLKKVCPQHHANSFWSGNYEINFICKNRILNNLDKKTKISSFIFLLKNLFKKILGSRFFSSNFSWHIYWLFNKLRHYKILKNAIKTLKYSSLIHLHNCFDVFLIKDIIPSNTIKVLTIHSPESIIKEIEKNNFKNKFLDKIYEIEKKAFQWADVLIYPCRESLENHLQTFPYLKEIVPIKKIFYCPTGIQKLEVKYPKLEVRKRFLIPQGAFTVSYIGRHIEVKGFDLLAQAIVRINNKLPDNKKIYLITAGKGNLGKKFSKNKTLKKIWRHIEWVEFPGDIINTSDCFVLPNRRTFFDLALLEAMSIGIPILASDSGGNKYVKKTSSGIILFKPQVEDLIEYIDKMRNMSNQQRLNMGRENYKSFAKYFSLRHFALNYIKAIRSIFK